MKKKPIVAMKKKNNKSKKTAPAREKPKMPKAELDDAVDGMPNGPKSGMPAGPQSGMPNGPIDLLDPANANIKMILVCPAGDVPAALEMRDFVAGSAPLMRGTPIRSKPRLADQLDCYHRLLDSPYIEMIRVSNPALRAAGFRSCYVDEEGKLNGKKPNGQASNLCDVRLVGSVLFFRSK